MRYPLAVFLSLITSTSAAALPERNLNPAFVDLHFGTLAGVGWYPAEPGGVIEATALDAVSVGSFSIPVSNTDGFSRGQLACYESDDKTFYPVVIKDVIAGAALRIDRPLPSAIAAGGKVFNFYNNDAHANHYGFKCVADDALRQLGSRPMLRRAAQQKGSSGWELISGAQVAGMRSAGYGSVDDGAGMAVQVHAAGGGVASKPEVMTFENMVTTVVVNPGTQAGKQSALLDISVVELRKSGEVIEAAKVRVSRDDTVISQDIPYTIVAGSQVRIKMTVPTSGDSVFYPGSITHYHALSAPENYNHGKHVLFGDSWFVSGGDFHYRLIERLNKADVISKGIVGNRSDQLVARFFKDVATVKPDYVWVMVGTNDYHAGMPSRLFQMQMAFLLNYIQSVGAKPIFFNPTVGAMAPSASTDQMQKSRSYALNTLYVPAVMLYRSPLVLEMISPN